MGRITQERLNRLEKGLHSKRAKIPFQPFIWLRQSKPTDWQVLNMRGGFPSAQAAAEWYESIAGNRPHASPIVLDTEDIWKDGNA